MAGNDISRLPDPQLNAKVSSILSTLIDTPAPYGLNGAEVEAAEETNTDFELKIGQASAADQAKLSAFADKDAVRSDLLAQMSSIIHKVYADPSVDDTMLRKAGLAPRPGKPQYLTPTVPSEPTATVTGPTEITVKWRRNGNLSSTRFFVEVKYGAGEWGLLTVVTATKFVHRNIAPGQQVGYRIYGERGTRQGPTSTEVVVWLGGDQEVNLSVAA